METLITTLQVIIALGIFNVWLIRPNRASVYRGKKAQSLRAEFAAYGLSYHTMLLIGFLKVSLAVLLVIGIWVPVLIKPIAGCMIILMSGAVAMHLKVKDPFIRILPALLMLAMLVVVALV